MKVITVLSFDVAEVEDVSRIVKQLDPESITEFKHELRVVLDPYASIVEQFLDE